MMYTDFFPAPGRDWPQPVIDKIVIRFPESDFVRELAAQKAAIEANFTTHEILKIAEETNKIVKETGQRLIITQHKLDETFVLVNGTYRLVEATLQKVDEAHGKLDIANEKVNKVDTKLEGLLSALKKKNRCDAEKICDRCGGLYACTEQYRWTENVDGCCPTGYRTSCCETTTTSTTTTTTMTTTTTDEKLLCRKAVWESHPTDGIQKYENPDKFCGRADRHCYVLNCTIVLDSPEFDGRFFGYRAEWGCIETKASLWTNFNQSDGWKNVVQSTCNPFFGQKDADMSNHKINVPIFNTSVLSSLWCKGGHFWMGKQQKNVTVCQKHEHYCYAVNCTLALAAGKSGVMQPEHYVLTKWGCTDNKKSAEIVLEESEAKQLIGQNDAIRYQSHVCSGQVGQPNVSMSNARFEVPTPPKLCKKAYLSKKLGYNDSFVMSCDQSEHYCYVLNCSSSVKGHSQSEVMTEWGCTDNDYTTEDFRLGKGRNWANTFLGPIPKSSTCLSFVDTSSNVDKLIPVIESSNVSNLTSKCKRVHLTADGKKIPPKDDCRPGEDACYAIHCRNTTNRQEIMEWGCTTNISQIRGQKLDEFGYDLSKKSEQCNFFVGTTNEEITFKSHDNATTAN
uniref:Uncharacterized protein n=1 Tax=Globodera rostochiensis TaxID=31243 RepID=A0A914HAV0_GLORO